MIGSVKDIGTNVKSIASTSSKNPEAGKSVDKAAGNESGGGFAVAGSLSLTYFNHDINAIVGSSAALTSDLDVNVTAGVKDKTQLFATTEATKPEGGKATASVAVSLGLGIYNNTARAIVSGCPLLATADIPDPSGLISRLQSDSDPLTSSLSQYLWDERFSDRVKDLLNDPDSTAEQRQAALIGELNRIIQGDSLYETGHFGLLPLSAEANDLIGEDPEGERLVRLNRMLLQEAYSSQISSDGLMQAGAGVDAKDTVRVDAAVEYPFMLASALASINPANYLKDSGPDGWGYFNDGTLGFASNLFNVWVMAEASESKVGIGGAFGIPIYNNDAEAIIERDAMINQDSGARFRTGPQVVEVNALTLMKLIEITGIGGLSISPSGGFDAFKEVQKGWKDGKADSLQSGLKELINPFGAEGDKGGIGASVLLNLTTNTTIAKVENGAHVYTGTPGAGEDTEGRGLTVSAQDDVFNFALAQSGANASSFAISGSIVVGAIRTETTACIVSGAVVDGGPVSVLASDDMTRISIAGAVVAGRSLGVGVSIAMNLI